MVAVTALAIFALGGAAVASAHGGFGGGGSSEYIDRVAEILGVSSEDLQSAMQQARSEAAEARLAERLTQAVEDEVLTQEEADAIQAWFDGKPDALESLTREQSHDLRDAERLGLVAEFLSGLVDDEVLTQAEADEIATWLDAKPTEALEKFRPERGFGGPGFGGRGGHHRFGGPRFGHHGPFGGDDAPATEDTESEATTASNPI